MSHSRDCPHVAAMAPASVAGTRDAVHDALHGGGSPRPEPASKSRKGGIGGVFAASSSPTAATATATAGTACYAESELGIATLNVGGARGRKAATITAATTNTAIDAAAANTWLLSLMLQTRSRCIRFQ